MSSPFADESEEKRIGEEPWLISYADMMTLLFGFFVLMYVFANQGDSNSTIRENLAKHFGGDYAEDSSFKKIAEEFKKKVEGSEILKDVEVKVSPEAAEFTFRSTVLFKSGKAEVLPQAQEALEVLVSLLSERASEMGVVVEGHTDDRPISQVKFPSNWELSGGRASSVLRIFEKFGFAREHLLAKAYADTKPAFPNYDENKKPIENNRAKNRRVVIHVFKTGSWSAAGKE